MPECYRLVIFIPKKVGMPERLPVMGMLEENKVFISSRPGCILYRFYEMESWAYCIPFGEETADLVGSACDYEENE
jgi:hypothetical protein